MNNQYSTLSKATKALIKMGYKHNFRITKNGELVNDNDTSFKPFEVTLHEFHRFEGMSSSGDSSIVYALETNSGSKGLLIDAYGADNSILVSDFMKGVNQTEE